MTAGDGAVGPVTVNIHEAKTQLSKLVDQAANGEAFVIAKAGKPLVRVPALKAPAAPQRLALPGGRDRRAGGFRPDGRGGDRRLLRRGLLDNGYIELPVTSQHSVSRPVRKV